MKKRVLQRDGKWYGSAVYTQKRPGFGRYEFWLVGPVDRMDRNEVLGLFNYPTRDVGPDGTHEIDIEFAQWGSLSAPSGNYTVWPTTNSVSRESKAFTFALDGGSTKHSFHWTSTNIVFESQETPADDRTRQLATRVFQPTNPALLGPMASTAKVHLDPDHGGGSQLVDGPIPFAGVDFVNGKGARCSTFMGVLFQRVTS